MYGYVRAYPPELRVREQEYYRAVYCGLCRREGQCTGQASRLALSYDFAFMAIVRMALTGERPTFRKHRCPIHPMKKRLMAAAAENVPAPDALTLCACASAILACHKVGDDLHDEKGGRRLRAYLARPAAAGARRRALKGKRSRRAAPVPGWDEMDGVVRRALGELDAIERSAQPSVDVPAECFGGLMAELLSWGLPQDGPAARLAREIGRHVGRWVYIIDAVDDYEEDAARGRYNPFACLYGDGAPALSDAHKEAVRAALLTEIQEIRCAVDLLEIGDRDLEGIIRNVLDEGMPRVAADVLGGRFGKKSDKARAEGQPQGT